jgi:hypothetical protein
MWVRESREITRQCVIDSQGMELSWSSNFSLSCLKFGFFCFEHCFKLGFWSLEFIWQSKDAAPAA